MNQPRKISTGRYRIGAAGFTLIELMIAMLLGLVVIGAVGSVFLAGQQTYRSNEALSDVQESSRIAFEMLTRDIRNAGENGCDSTSGRVANVLNNQSAWWANWGNAVRGYDAGQADPGATFGTGERQRVAGTDSIQLIGASALPVTIEPMQDEAANFKLNEPTSQLSKGDIIVICDPDHAAILQISNYNSTNVTVGRNTGNSQWPGNCSKGLGFPTDCSSVKGNGYSFGNNAQIAKMAAVDWYIGNNDAGGRSLYRVALGSAGTSADGDATLVPQEMVRNVTDMQITYLQSSSTAFIDASSGTNWALVTAVRVILTVQSTDQRVGTDAKALERTVSSTTTVRNRVN
jgi:type IV pilus assembly protein PilW